MIELKPIGVIHTPFKKGDEVPIQPVFADEAKGTVEVFPEYLDGLEGISQFSHLFLIYHFHLVNNYKLKSKPYLEDIECGIFSIRSPRRPNRLGLSIVKLISVDKNRLKVSGVDMLNGTPLLDIKPYVKLFDARTDSNNGWIKETSIIREKTKGKI